MPSTFASLHRVPAFGKFLPRGIDKNFKMHYHQNMGGHYKDSLFRSLFSEKSALLELYNAITGSNLGPETDIVINTLEETLFTVRKNDVSFSFQDRLVVLFDHQASINKNMPLRFLEPVFRLFENGILDKKAIYRSKQIKLPWPEFIVLYNGEAPYPESAEERLSDAFAPPPKAGQDPNLELVARVYNINAGMNREIVEKCRTIRDYSAFVSKERELEKLIRKEYPELDRKVVLRRAIVQTIEYCKTHDILKEYLEKLTMEEQNMLAREWNLEDAIAVAKEEGRETGIEEGQKAILELFKQGYTVEQVEEMLANGGNKTLTATVGK